MFISTYAVVDESRDDLDGDGVGFFIAVDNLLDPDEDVARYSITSLNSKGHGQCLLIQLSSEILELNAAEYLLVDVPIHVIQAARSSGLVITDLGTGLSLKFKIGMHGEDPAFIMGRMSDSRPSAGRLLS